MATKFKRIKEIRPATGQLDVNDALRLAVQDERFSRALISNPEQYASAFNMRDIEIEAIKDAIGDIDTGAFEYE